MSIDRTRTKELGPWLAGAKLFWPSAAVILAALVVCLRPHTAEPVIRLTGGVLQLMGIGTVVWGISETRALFGRPSLASKVKAYLLRFPLWRRKQVISVGVGEIISAADTVSAQGWVAPPVNGTTEARIDVLEAQMVMTRERMDQS